MTTDLLDYDDIGEALREGRPLRPARAYRILYAQGDLTFRALDLTDPVPLGRQILASAGVDPRGSVSLFAILESGDFEDVRLDEPFDLRQRGAERFIGFESDRDFRLTLNDAQLTWGKPFISGAVLYRLGKAGEGDAVFLEVRGGTDRLIGPHELVDLTGAGVERFFTAPNPGATFEIIVNSRPRVVTGRAVTFEQIVQLAFPGPHEANVVFSMTYRHAASQPHAGELAAGGVVQIKNGSIFNVTRTVQS